MWAHELDRWIGNEKHYNGSELENFAAALHEVGVEVNTNNVLFLADLQAVHDGTDIPAEGLDEESLEQYIHDTRQYWKERFAVIADRYSLDKTVLN